MRDFEYSKKLQSKHLKFNKKYPGCKKALCKVAYKIYQLKKEKIYVPGEVTLENLKPAIENSIIRIDYEKVLFSERTTFLYFLATYLIETQLLQDWEDNSQFANKLRKLCDIYIQFEYSKNLDAMILMVLNNEYGMDICSKIASLSKKDNRIFWDIYNPFVDILPFLKVKTDSLVCALSNILKLTKNDMAGGFVFRAVEKLSREEPQIGEYLYQALIKKPLSNAVYFIPSVLVGLSDKIEVSKIYQWAFDLTNEKDIRLIQTGILSCSLLDYNKEYTKPLLEKTLKKFNSMLTDKRKEILSALAKGFGNLIKVSEEAKEQVVKLSKLQIPEIQYEISRTLHLNSKEHCSENWVKESINNLSFVDVKYEGITTNIEFCLHAYLKDNPRFIFSFLDLWISNHKLIKEELSVISIFERAILESYNYHRDVVEEYLTLWFSKDDKRFHLAASNIVREFNIHKINLKLNKNMLNSLSAGNIEFVIKKILGYVFKSEALCELVFSVLQRSTKEEKVYQLVQSAFKEYVTYNYPGTSKKYLTGKLKTGEKVEKKVARKILKNLESYWEKIKSLPRLREFEPPDRRIEYFRKLEAKEYSKIFEQAQETSIVRRIATNIILKGGKTSFTKIEGKYTEKSPLASFEAEFELPRGELIDPTGQAFMRSQWRTLKRKIDQNETDNS